MRDGAPQPAALAWARQQLQCCVLCPRQCHVNRADSERGWCGTGPQAHVFQHFVNYSEEAVFGPTNAILLGGCNLACVFCHTRPEQNQSSRRKLLTTKYLIDIVASARQEVGREGRTAGSCSGPAGGVRDMGPGDGPMLNVYGGEPNVSLPGLLPLLARCRDELPPIIWNTNLYCTPQVTEVVAAIFDQFIVDLKFGPGACSSTLADAVDYWPVVTARLRQLCSLVGPDRILVRHLQMPGHLECCTRPVLRWLADQADPLTVSMKSRYLPMPGAAGHEELQRFLDPGEAIAARDFAVSLGLDLCPEELGQSLAVAVPGAGVNGEGDGVDAELVFAPSGQLYVRNASASVVTMVRSVCGDSGPLVSTREPIGNRCRGGCEANETPGRSRSMAGSGPPRKRNEVVGERPSSGRGSEANTLPGRSRSMAGSGPPRKRNEVAGES